MNELFQVIDNEQDKMVSLLKEWASINSYSDNLKGLSLMLQKIKEECVKLNVELHEIELPARNKVDAKGNIYQMPHGKALTLKKYPDAKIQLLFGGHYDTVFPENSSFQHVTLLDANTLQGPGVADMKGGLIVMLTALQVLENSPYKGKFGYEVIINPDEEIGSVGSEELYKKAAIGKKAGLIFEPSFANGALVNSRKGSANFTITAFGKPAHAGRDFFLGKSAISALSTFIHEADKLNSQKKGITLNFGHIEGGVTANIVPEFAINQVNVRYLKEKDFEKVLQKLFLLIQKIEEKKQVKLQIHEVSSRGPKPFDVKTRKLFDILKKVGLKMGTALEFASSGGVSDGNILASMKLPTIDTLGVIGGNLHTDKEYMLLNSLKERVKLTVSLIIELIGN